MGSLALLPLSVLFGFQMDYLESLLLLAKTHLYGSSIMGEDRASRRYTSSLACLLGPQCRFCRFEIQSPLCEIQNSRTKASRGMICWKSFWGVGGCRGEEQPTAFSLISLTALKINRSQNTFCSGEWGLISPHPAPAIHTP